MISSPSQVPVSNQENGANMRKIINKRNTQVDPAVLQGFKDLLKIYSPSCVVADSQERAGVMRSYLRPLT